MKHWKRGILGALGAVGLAATSLVASAEVGVTGDTVLLDHIAGFSGQVAASVKEQHEAAKAYFETINKSGGIHGRRIVLKPLDDKFDPKQTGEQTKAALAAGDPPFAFFVPRGTPHLEAMLKVAQPAGVPIVGPQSGAALWHQPVNPLIFNVKARYQDEVMAGVKHFATVGVNRIALLHVADSFGNDALKGFETGMAQVGLKPVKIMSFDRVKQDSTTAVPEMLKADPQAVLVVGSAAAVPPFIKAMRQAGSNAQFMTLSNNASSGFLKNLGEFKRGVMMTQVTPPADSSSTAMGREFQKLAAPRGVPATYSAMEGFAAAKVVVEGLKRAGRDLTREKFIRALETLKRFDLGGMEVDYGPDDHSGSRYVDITIIREDGKFLR